MNNSHEYEIVIGLEVHARLLTNTKLFCGDANSYGAEPNTLVSPISLAHPGTLPKMNRKAIGFAVRLGLATNCSIVKENFFARKNYFYPDLPKGYQVSQHTTPICREGWMHIDSGNGSRKIRINRIHLEEDAGKSLHDVDPKYTCLDFNRAGTPLVEIVTEPDLRSGEEAFLFLSRLRKLVRDLEICDGNMEEGSLRCDANISVRKKGDSKLGVKTEIKNLNSVRNVRRVIESEANRQITLLQGGQIILQETRAFDAASGTSFSSREKEDADDYRYFPDPDLVPFEITDDFIGAVQSNMPELAEERSSRFEKDYGLSVYDAGQVADEKGFSRYFESLIRTTGSPNAKACVNWMIGPVRSWLNDNDAEIDSFPVSPSRLSTLIKLVDENRCSFSAATGKILPELIKDPDQDPLAVATSMGLVLESDSKVIDEAVENVLNNFADKVAEYRKGKKGLLALFVGEVMKKTRGKADPKLVNETVLKKLSQ